MIIGVADHDLNTVQTGQTGGDGLFTLRETVKNSRKMCSVGDVFQTLFVLLVVCEVTKVCRANNYYSEKEYVAEKEKIKQWNEKPARVAGTELVDWRHGHERSNYTVDADRSGFSCKVKSGEFGDEVEVFFAELSTEVETAASCVNVVVSETRVNCDEEAENEGFCKGGLINYELERLRFDGTSSCDDSSRAINIRYGYDISIHRRCCFGHVRNFTGTPVQYTDNILYTREG
jgi:hypothetical protein